MAKNKYTEFYDVGKGVFEVWNIIYNQKVGEIRKARMGKWMHWQLFSAEKEDLVEELGNIYTACKDCTVFEIQDKIGDLLKKVDKDNIGFSNGCLKEISKFITPLYSKEKEEEKKTEVKTPEKPKEKEEDKKKKDEEVKKEEKNETPIN